MKIAEARRIIEASPRTHLGIAARAVLAVYDECDPGRAEQAAAHVSVVQEALDVAKEEAERHEQSADYWRSMHYEVERELTRTEGVAEEQKRQLDAVAEKLVTAQAPDPSLTRLRALEETCEALVKAIPPLRAEGRAAYDLIVRTITPYLTR